MKTTNFVKASYSEVIDLQTVNGKTTVIGIHTPQGSRPYMRMFGLFRNFRMYKYLGCSLKMVPAANLPVDPLGLTGVPGTTDLMDPRDMLNPIISHGCHGESLTTVLNMIYRRDANVNANGEYVDSNGGHVSSSAVESSYNNSYSAGDVLNQYYMCLTDPTWKKWGIQNGVSLKNLHPLVHNLGMNHPITPFIGGNSNMSNAGRFHTLSKNASDNGIDSESVLGAIDPLRPSAPIGIPQIEGLNEGTVFYSDYQMMTSGMVRLGWLPTVTTGIGNNPMSRICVLPKLFMSVLILPPSYNVEQFFRMVITHRFAFKGFTTSLGGASMSDDLILGQTHNSYFNWIDYSTVSGKSVENVTDLSPIDEGTSLDMIDGSSTLVADGVR